MRNSIVLEYKNNKTEKDGNAFNILNIIPTIKT